jgi:hypothetical protein
VGLRSLHFGIRGPQVAQDVVEVHFHVSLLNTGGHKRSHGGKVLRQPNCGYNAHEFGRSGVA